MKNSARVTHIDLDFGSRAEIQIERVLLDAARMEQSSRAHSCHTNRGDRFAHQDPADQDSTHQPPAHEIPSPALPESFNHLLDVPHLAKAWELQLQERRAAAQKLALVVDYRVRCREEAHTVISSSPAAALVASGEAGRAVVREIAMILTMSERATTALLNAAEYCRENLPTGLMQERVTGLVSWSGR